MLTGIRLKNFRAYEDTGRISLTKLNLFIGANNAGKSSFASAIELLFRTMAWRGDRQPLAISLMPGMSSFDSVLRQHWGPNQARQNSFQIEYFLTTDDDAGGDDDGDGGEGQFTVKFSRDAGDNSPVADSIAYQVARMKVVLTKDKRIGSRKYKLKTGDKTYKAQDLFFNGLIPYPMDFEENSKVWSSLRRNLISLGVFRDYRPLEVVSPSRPVPRSVYVLDDPNLGVEDKDLIAYLINLFTSSESDDGVIRERIKSHLSTLGLATDFDVSSVSRKTASKIVQLRIAPRTKRQKLTIADVGFGASQVLPLVVKDARLSDGVMIAYQPEVHLHPYAQSRLADVLVDSVRRGNQAFIETHSQDLILRLQLLISTGAIAPSDVAVFCFENTTHGSSVKTVEFIEGGVPKDGWPKGFLDTSIDLARRLAADRLSKMSAGSGRGV